MNESPKYKITKADLPTLLKAAGLGVAMSLVSWATEFIHEVDYDMWTPIVMGVAVPVLATVKRWLTDYTKK